MIGNPQLKKYVGKSPEWYYKKALAALARREPSFSMTFVRSLGINSGCIYVKGISAVLALEGYFSVPIYTFDLQDTAALRAQAIYWNAVHNIGGKVK